MKRQQSTPVHTQTAPPDEPGVEVFYRPSPIGDGVWTDAEGKVWRLRGKHSQIPPKRVYHLLCSPAVQVLHIDGSGTGPGYEFKDVSLLAREALWHRMSPYLRGTIDRSSGDYTDFRVGEFKNDQRNSLLIIEEYC